MTELRKARRVNRLTGIEVGKLVGITAATLYRYETKHRVLPVPVAKKLGKLYGVPWEVFYEDDGETAFG